MPDKKIPNKNEKDTASDSHGSLESRTKKTAIIEPAPNTDAIKTQPAKTKVLDKKMPSSKLAGLALLLAIVTIAGSTAHYLWQQQKNLSISREIGEQRTQAIKASQAVIEEKLNSEFSKLLLTQLAQQQQKFTQQLKQVTQQTLQENKGSVAQLSQQVEQLAQRITQRQPSEWLIHEAEYLIRVAARTLWLKHDTKAAIGLLKEADTRLSELNQPKFLSVRAAINQDITALALMPNLENEQALLTLIALNKQVKLLPLTGINLNEAVNQEDLQLSNDINDWQTNLHKTWQQFLSDFITVQRRKSSVEPLLSPEQHQHLKQNLRLKIQLAQWAASEKKALVYQQILQDSQDWMIEFFDMEADINKKFYQALTRVKQHPIYLDYPNEFSALAAMTTVNNKRVNITKVQQKENPSLTPLNAAEQTMTKPNPAAQKTTAPEPVELIIKNNNLIDQATSVINEGENGERL